MSTFDMRPVNTEHPLFERIWLAIKGWDIQRIHGEGYAGATGTDVQVIIDAISAEPPQPSQPADDECVHEAWERTDHGPRHESRKCADCGQDLGIYPRQDEPSQPEGRESDLLAIARDTGLRSLLHGVNASDARDALQRFVAAVRIRWGLTTPPAPHPTLAQPEGEVVAQARLWRCAKDFFEPVDGGWTAFIRAEPGQALPDAVASYYAPSTTRTAQGAAQGDGHE